ncbi:MAG: sugar phosphate isomerase/epimerase [bacterium]|nr:sugar phosphate isomerase/epimerase [bacterium]
MNRRTFLQAGAGATVGMGLATAAASQEKRFQDGASPWPICINTSTIRPCTLQDKIRIAAEAGYDGIEPWVNDLEKYEAEGGDLKALGAEIRDRGLFVPNVIGLWSCMPATPEAFQASLEATRNRMRIMAAIGSQHAAAIPTPDREDFDLAWGTHCYRELLRIGREEFNIIAAFEFVGFLKGVHRLGQACAIAIDANDPDACVIADTFHLSRGGSGFKGVQHIAGDLIANFHWNDVPADPAPDQQGDEHRIYPGDGILPLVELLKDLKAIGYTGPLSLEMFNRAQWEQDPLEVARTGKRKMMDLIAQA